MMKKTFSILAAVFLTASVYSQISYQAVIRDANNKLIANQSIGIQVTIIEQNGPIPHVLYSETYSPNPTTNSNGLVSIAIGNGTPVTGTFSGINWTNGGIYSIKTDIDPTGGTNNTITGMSTLLYVPFAIHAQNADSVKYLNPTPITAGNNIMVKGSGTTASPYVINDSIYKIGDTYGGGIVFYVYDNGRHGLIAATTDQSIGGFWTTISNQGTTCNAVRDGVKGGQINTERIISQAGGGSYAAQLCANYKGGNFADWYLPSLYELNLLYMQKSVVGGFTVNYYWTSSEAAYDGALGQSFNNGSQDILSKTYNGYVRAIRSF